MLTTHAISNHTGSASRRRLPVALLFAVALIAAACSSDGGTSEAASVDDFVNGTAAPTTATVDGAAGEEVDFRFTNFDGEPVAFSSINDRPVVLNFFASWCPTCIAEMPDFEAVNQSFGGEVQFLGLAFQDRLENAIDLVDETGITYTAGIDDGGNAFALFNGLGMPTTVFIDANGVVQNVHTGVLSQSGLTDMINEHLL